MHWSEACDIPRHDLLYYYKLHVSLTLSYTHLLVVSYVKGISSSR